MIAGFPRSGNPPYGGWLVHPARPVAPPPAAEAAAPSLAAARPSAPGRPRSPRALAPARLVAIAGGGVAAALFAVGPPAGAPHPTAFEMLAGGLLLACALLAAVPGRGRAGLGATTVLLAAGAGGLAAAGGPALVPLLAAAVPGAAVAGWPGALAGTAAAVAGGTAALQGQPAAVTVPAGGALAAAAVTVVAAVWWAREARGRQAAALSRAARQAQTVARAAEAGTAVASLDPERALDAVVDAACGLDGVRAAAIGRFDPAAGTWTVTHPHGLPEVFVERRTWAVAGLPGVLRGGRTVVARDYPGRPGADPALAAAGVGCVVAVPAWVEGPYEAALLAFATDRDVAAEEVHALEVLAGQARAAIASVREVETAREAARRLREVDRLKTDFLASVSHELRTPLAILRGITALLPARWSQLEDHRREELLGQLRDAAGQLGGIIEALLDFSALQLVEGTRCVRVPLTTVLRTLAARLEPLFEAGTLTVEVTDGLVVEGDPGLLERAVEELLANARRHTPPGTPVVLRAARTDGAVMVAVADAGPGIPPEDAERLGERFFRPTDPEHRGSGGLGLGLALVREILRLHGSALSLRSTPGEGTTVSFALPAAPAGHIPPAVPSPPSR